MKISFLNKEKTTAELPFLILRLTNVAKFYYGKTNLDISLSLLSLFYKNKKRDNSLGTKTT